MGDNPQVSIVIPAYNEKENIEPLYREIKDVFTRQRVEDFEVIVVDDGSSDDTAGTVEVLAAQDSRVKLVQLFRNFGHQKALAAGLQYARGDATVLMDADFQHPPCCIQELLARYNEGYDIVRTIRRGDQKGFCKNALSRLFYTLFGKITNIPIVPGAADFCLLSKRVVEVINTMPEREKFLRGILPWIGGRSITVDYHVQPRRYGVSKYTPCRSFRLALAGFLSFSTAPLDIIFWVGLVVSGASFSYGLYLIWYRVFVKNVPPGYTDIIVSILFLGGVQLISIGIVGKFVSLIFDEVRQRPAYIVRTTKGTGPGRG